MKFHYILFDMFSQFIFFTNVQFLNGYKETPNLNSEGKHNPTKNFQYPIKTTFINVTGESTFGEMNNNGIRFTGMQSGLSEIKIWGCGS